MKWRWQEVNPDFATTSGDIGKLFKNEAVDAPGVLKEGAPTVDATLLAREAIQNSWDAGRQLAKEMVASGAEPPSFRVRFEYRSYSGDEKASLVDVLGLGELAERLDLLPEGTDRRKLGLADDDCLSSISDPAEPLRVLQIVESGTTGMDGPWANARSKLYLAMVSTGFTAKAAGEGGSYGYGKSGLIRGSKIRTVVAHTCFRERDDDPRVTRRALGMTYWGAHGVYDGFARLGASDEARTVPFENDAADSFATSAGIEVRDPAVPRELGSTFLLVDPAVEPRDLLNAVERYWWPAIEDVECDFDVVVQDEQGHRHAPRPKKDPVLQTFIRGYELALAPQDNGSDDEARRDLSTYKPHGESHKRSLGVLGLVADMETWSYAKASDDLETGTDHASLIALVRGPRMVVDYYRASRTPPHVRGTFLADAEIDELLRQTEPKAHDRWLSKDEEEGIDPVAPKFARVVLERIRKQVSVFRQQLKPPPTREQDIRLPLLDDLFRRLLHNGGTSKKPVPVGDPRLVSIGVDQQPELVDDSRIRLRAKVTTRLTDKHPADSAECRIVVRLAFDEDGTRGDDVDLDAEFVPPGFAVTSNVPGVGTSFVGELDHSGAQFELVSVPYDEDWSAQLIVTGDPLVAGGDASADEKGPTGE